MKCETCKKFKICVTRGTVTADTNAPNKCYEAFYNGYELSDRTEKGDAYKLMTPFDDDDKLESAICVIESSMMLLHTLNMTCSELEAGSLNGSLGMVIVNIQRALEVLSLAAGDLKGCVDDPNFWTSEKLSPIGREMMGLGDNEAIQAEIERLQGMLK